MIANRGDRPARRDSVVVARDQGVANGAGDMSATQLVSRPSTDPASRNAATTSGRHPMYPTTCPRPRGETSRLFGSIGRRVGDVRRRILRVLGAVQQQHRGVGPNRLTVPREQGRRRHQSAGGRGALRPRQVLLQVIRAFPHPGDGCGIEPRPALGADDRPEHQLVLRVGRRIGDGGLDSLGNRVEIAGRGLMDRQRDVGRLARHEQRVDLRRQGVVVDHDRRVRPRVEDLGRHRVLGQPRHGRRQLARRVREGLRTRGVRCAPFEDGIERALGIAWDQLEHRDVEERAAVQHRRSDVIRMLPEVVLHERRSVRAPIEIDPVVAERLPNGVEVVGSLRARVEALIGVEVRQVLVQPRLEGGDRVRARHAGHIGPRLRQLQRVGVAGPPLVHEHDVPARMDLGERTRRGRPVVGRGAARPARDEEDRVGGGIRNLRREDHDVELDLPPRRVGGVLRHGEQAAHGAPFPRALGHRLAVEQEGPFGGARTR